jgi:hypothetical protein
MTSITLRRIRQRRQPGFGDRAATEIATTVVRETFDYASNMLPALLDLVGFPAKNATAMTASLDRMATMMGQH